MTTEHNAAVDAIIESAGVKVICTPTGATKRADWECDGWHFTLSKTNTAAVFEYFTGTGHRELSTAAKQRVNIAYPLPRHPGTVWHRKYIAALEQAKKPVAPHVAGLIHSVLLDSQAAEMSFASWCADYGYDTDSRKDLATYGACQENSDKFNRLFNSDQRAALAAALEDY